MEIRDAFELAVYIKGRVLGYEPKQRVKYIESPYEEGVYTHLIVKMDNGDTYIVTVAKKDK